MYQVWMWWDIRGIHTNWHLWVMDLERKVEVKKAIFMTKWRIDDGWKEYTFVASASWQGVLVDRDGLLFNFGNGCGWGNEWGYNWA